jgi:hypothetical protein
MDLGAGSGAAFGRQNVAARRSPRDHRNAIELVLRAKQNKLRENTSPSAIMTREIRNVEIAQKYGR